MRKRGNGCSVRTIMPLKPETALTAIPAFLVMMALRCLNHRTDRWGADVGVRGVLMLVLGVACALPATAANVRGVKLVQGATGTRAEIVLDGPAEYTLINLHDPDRLVVDFKDSSLSPAFKAPGASGVVGELRTGTPEPGATRIVFDLRANVVPLDPHMETRGNERVLVLDWPGDDDAVAVSPQQAPTITRAPVPVAGVATGVPTRIATGVPTPMQPPVESPQPRDTTPPANTTPTTEAPVRSMAEISRRTTGRPLTIAIDAGHGGQDTGARGASGSFEKNITLQVAKELARQVNATPGMRAYLTRDSDFFIPLVQRYQKARAHKADMFVSIHADAFTDPSASGSSVWVLSRRGQTSQAARWLADQENAADLVGGVRLRDKDNTLASVLLDLSQSATQRASEEIAGQVLRGLADLGKTHRGAIDRANFVVLRSPDVPSMLVETAFISNPDEERRLNNPDYQHELAHAVLNGIHTYFRRQPPPGTQYWSMYGEGGSVRAAASR